MRNLMKAKAHKIVFGMKLFRNQCILTVCSNRNFSSMPHSKEPAQKGQLRLQQSDLWLKGKDGFVIID